MFLAFCLSLDWPHLNIWTFGSVLECSEFLCGWPLAKVFWLWHGAATKPGIGIFDHWWHFLRGWSRDGKGGGLKWRHFAFIFVEKNQWKVPSQPRLRCTIPRQACNSCQFAELLQYASPESFPVIRDVSANLFFPSSDLTPTQCALQAWTPCLSRQWARQGMLQNGNVNIPTCRAVIYIEQHLPGYQDVSRNQMANTEHLEARLLWAEHATKDADHSLSSIREMSSVKHQYNVDMFLIKYIIYIYTI